MTQRRAPAKYMGGTAPARRVAYTYSRIGFDLFVGGWGTVYLGEQIVLTCGHEANGKPRKNGTYACYECRDAATRTKEAR